MAEDEVSIAKMLQVKFSSAFGNNITWSNDEQIGQPILKTAESLGILARNLFGVEPGQQPDPVTAHALNCFVFHIIGIRPDVAPDDSIEDTSVK